MFDESDPPPPELHVDPAQRAAEASAELRMHAHLAAAYEGPRKFDAALLPDFDADMARLVQRDVARLEKAKLPDVAILPHAAQDDAAKLLDYARQNALALGDYHIHRRPGEVIIVRWLAGEQVATFYERLQAHFDAGLTALRDEQRSLHGWKGEPATLAYLDALDAIDDRMEERFLRGIIKEASVAAMSTVAADEMNIQHLCEYLMGVPSAAVVGKASAAPENATEQDLAWYFKLYSLRGVHEGVEQMCLFTFLQKSDDTFDF